jgi:uncharacterized protein YndB with AHSA1/START domain
VTATTRLTGSLPRPDLSARPHHFTVERDMKSSAERIYWAWTEGFDTWFARPGAIHMRAEVDELFWFETEHMGCRHAHYGRFLGLEPNRFIELTWMTGTPGTAGAETMVTIELTPLEEGTRLRLTHAGFYDEDGLAQHDSAWPELLPRIDSLPPG